MEDSKHRPSEEKPTRSGAEKETPTLSREPGDRQSNYARPRGGAHSVAGSVQRQARDSEAQPQTGRNLWIWTCPACGFSQPDPAEECPKCGVVVSKFQEREGVRHDSESPRRDRDDHADAPKVRTWTTLLIGMGVCALVAVIGLKWVLKGTKGRDRGSASVPGQALGQVKRFTVQNFGTAVVAQSEKMPVLVEFYAQT